MIAEERIDQKSIEILRRTIKGMGYLPDEAPYHTFARSWNLNAGQRPALVVVASSAADIVAAVRFAGERDLGVGVMATGHGVGTRCDGGVLINTSRMRGVKVDPQQRTVRVEAGALWKDVIGVAHEHGLATLAGSAPHVGVVGYTMGGGFGFFGRKYGLNANSITAAEVVTAEGKLVRANSQENAELFWCLKGGGGNFGIVVSLEFRLYPVTNVYGGAVFYPAEQGREVLAHFSQWTKDLPDEITVALAFMNVPDVPAVPPMLRGRSVVGIKGCYCGDDLRAGEEHFAPVRKLFKPIVDTFETMPVTAMDAISKDPVDPMGVLQYGAMLRDLTADTMEAILSVTGPSSPLSVLELRKLGGALDRDDDDMNLMGAAKAQFLLNALGGTPTSMIAEKVTAQLARVAEATKPYVTGEVFLNVLEVDPTPERVRAAYTPQDWQKLTHYKTKFDPRNLFRFNRNIPPSTDDGGTLFS